MKVALLGATGFVGSALLKEALDRGHVVTAIVPDPEKLEEREGLTAKASDVYDTASLATLIRGNEAIISAFNPGWKNPNLYDDQVRGTASIMQLGTLLDAALALMAKVLQPLGTALTTLPVGSSYPGRTTGFAFEMHYVLGNMTPHREPAWALLAERGRMLAHRCSQVAAEPSHHADLPALTGQAAAHAHAIAGALTAQVPAELRPEPGQAIRL